MRECEKATDKIVSNNILRILNQFSFGHHQMNIEIKKTEKIIFLNTFVKLKDMKTILFAIFYSYLYNFICIVYFFSSL